MPTRLHDDDPPRLCWRPADPLDCEALTAAGFGQGSLRGVLERACFCAIEPVLRPAWIGVVTRLRAPG